MKHWNRVLLSLVAILLTLAIIVFINVLFVEYRNEKMEFGSWSDWVSALANIIMACAAIYAAINWIKQKKTTSNLELAHSTLLSHEKNLWDIYNTAYECSLSLSQYEHWCKLNLDKDDDKRKIILNSLDLYPGHYLRAKSQIYSFLAKAKRYGITLHPDFEILQSKILEANDEQGFNHFECILYISKSGDVYSEEFKKCKEKFLNAQYELAHLFEKELSKFHFESTYKIKVS